MCQAGLLATAAVSVVSVIVFARGGPIDMLVVVVAMAALGGLVVYRAHQLSDSTMAEARVFLLCRNFLEMLLVRAMQAAASSHPYS